MSELSTESGYTCPGPFIWYACEGGAILHCSSCGHITVSGNWNETGHALTPVLSEGLAS